MNRPPCPPLPCALAALLTALAAPPAAAQDVDPNTLAAARALHDEAVADFDRGRYADACPKLERVVKLVPRGLGAQLTLAECYQRAGRLASAWKAYVALEEAAGKEGQGARQRLARQRSDELRPKLAMLTIEVQEPARSIADLEIRSGGEPLPPPLWGVPVPVDRGTRLVVATAPGKRPVETQVSVKDGAAVSVTIDAMASSRETDAANAARRAAEGSEGSGGLLASFSGPQKAGLGVAAVGVVTVGIGTFFGLRAISKNDASDADGHCDDRDRCDDIGYDLRLEARDAGTVSTMLFVTGGLALAGGATVFLLSPRRDGTAVEAALGLDGLSLRGRW